MSTILFITLICLCACKSNIENTNVTSNNISTKTIANKIKDNVIFKDDLQNIDNDTLKIIYPELQQDILEEFSVYVSASGATAEEISVFKLKDKGKVWLVKKCIEQRIKDQITNFENYVPEEVFKINNNIVNENENIISYIVSDTPEDVKIALDDIFSQNSK